MTSRFVDLSQSVYVTTVKATTELAGNLVEPGDIVVTQRGTLGQVSMLHAGSPRCVLSQSQMRLRVDRSVADPQFVLYAMLESDFQHQVLTSAISSGVPHINLALLAAFEIPLPPLDEQRRIAGVLGALNDLIDTNLRLGEFVREVSRASFERIAMDADELRIADVARVNPEQISARASGTLTYVDIASLGDAALSYSVPIPWQDAPGRARRLAKEGDTLWSMVRPNRRAHALLLDPPPDLVVSTGLAVLRGEAIGPATLFAATDRPAFTEHLVNRAEGSAYPAVRPDILANAPIPVPRPSVRDHFESTMWPLWQWAGALASENRQLAATRDELLPLLMSGRIRPGEVDL